MVVPSAERDLLVAGVTDPVADRRRLREVERRACDRVDRTRRDERRVDGRVVVGVQPEDVVVDVPRPLAGEVPVAVVRQVEDRRLAVDGGAVLDPQVVLTREHVRHVDAQRSGVALLAVRARVVELQPDAAVVRRDDGRGPDLVVEPVDAAVERVRRVVDRQVVRHPVEGERALGDPVRVAADDRPEIRAAGRERAVLGDVVVEGREPEHDVGRAAALVGHPELLDRAAVGDDLDHHPLAVVQGVAVDGHAAGRAERLLRDAGHPLSVVMAATMALRATGRDCTRETDCCKRQCDQGACECDATKQSGHLGFLLLPAAHDCRRRRGWRENAGFGSPSEPRCSTQSTRFYSPAGVFSGASSRRLRRDRRGRVGGGTRRRAGRTTARFAGSGT